MNRAPTYAAMVNGGWRLVIYLAVSIPLIAVIVRLLGLQPTWARAFGFVAFIVVFVVPVQLWLRRRQEAGRG